MKKLAFMLAVILGIITFTGTALADTWVCGSCGRENTDGNFCGYCGAKRPGQESDSQPIRASDLWGCTNCYHVNATDVCSNCGRTRPSAEETARSVAVPEPVYRALRVEGVFTGETLVIPEEEPVVYEGSISEDHEEDSYTFTAPRDGRYGFAMEDVMADARLRLRVWDSKNKNVLDTYADASYVGMTGGETYSIKVERNRGATHYSLKIGIQKPTTDLSAVTTVSDQVSYEDQQNIYTFTAPIAGLYRFDLTETKASLSFRLMMYDRLEKNILDTYAGNAYVILEAGETYELRVGQHKNLGSYVMRVYFQKETRDISGCDTVSDSVEYADQRNIYTFTPPVSGRYRFDLAESSVNTTYRMMMWDRYEKSLMDSYSGGEYADLEAGETYELQVRQHKGTDTYELRIGYQKEPVNLAGADTVYDRITYEDQQNVYSFTPSRSGKYTVTISHMNSSDRFRLMAWDKHGQTIMDQYGGEDTVTLEADETYTIQVRQHKGFDVYRLFIHME